MHFVHSFACFDTSSFIPSEGGQPECVYYCVLVFEHVVEGRILLCGCRMYTRSNGKPNFMRDTSRTLLEARECLVPLLFLEGTKWPGLIKSFGNTV